MVLRIVISALIASTVFIAKGSGFAPFVRALQFEAGRDQGSRIVTPLDENWHFGLSNENLPEDARPLLTKTVSVPHTWNATDMQNGGAYYAGGGWYEKTISISAQDLLNRHLFLRFEGVSSVAEVFVNDKPIGEHKGGFSAFCFDITSSLHPGSNLIDVRADNKPRPDVIPINMGLFPIYGGMYRHVELISVPRLCISPINCASPGVFVSESNVTAAGVDIKVTTDLQNFSPRFKNAKVQVDILDEKEKLVGTSTGTTLVSSGPISTFSLRLHLRNPHLWQGRTAPYLYHLKVTVKDEKGSEDSVSQTFGVRTFGIDPKLGFLLNGKPYRLYGVCRHQDKQDEGNALTDSEQQEDAETIYGMGCTAARLAHYQQADIMYSSFDKDGIVVWAEAPFVNANSGKESENAKQQVQELILQNYNHASISCWGVCNEVYGKTPNDYVPALIRDLSLEVHELDSHRFSYAVSGAAGPYGPEIGYADIQGINRYYGWYYGVLGDLQKWFDSMAKNRPGLFYALTEYGAEANIDQQQEQLPAKEDALGQSFPEGFQTEYHKASWVTIAAQKPLIASFIWNMFDFTVPGWNRGGVKARNMKGLITFDRKTKKDAYYWYKAHWSSDPVLHIVGRRLVKRSLATTSIEVFSNQGMPSISLNGTKLPPPTKGMDITDYVFANVPFKSGTNIMEASCTKSGKVSKDEVTWNFGT